jgi:hypothetical protein
MEGNCRLFLDSLLRYPLGALFPKPVNWDKHFSEIAPLHIESHVVMYEAM